ncbi:MAG: methyltransferase domain-containing protein [Gemmatimonadales bacterium]
MTELRERSTGTERPPVGLEALDDPSLDRRIARATLRDIARANRYFGGSAAVAYGVRRVLHGRPPSTVTILDVGAGAGDVLAWLQRSLARQGVSAVGMAVDWHREAATMARERGQEALVGDAHALPFGDSSLDIVVASQLLHHCSEAGSVRLVRELDRVARVGVVVADLQRAQLAVWGIWLAATVLRFHPVSRADGVVSVRRGFTTRELAGVCGAAGVEATICRRPGYRVVAFWRCNRAHG